MSHGVALMKLAWYSPRDLAHFTRPFHLLGFNARSAVLLQRCDFGDTANYLFIEEEVFPLAVDPCFCNGRRGCAHHCFKRLPAPAGYRQPLRQFVGE